MTNIGGKKFLSGTLGTVGRFNKYPRRPNQMVLHNVLGMLMIHGMILAGT